MTAMTYAHAYLTSLTITTGIVLAARGVLMAVRNRRSSNR